jgi:phage repressor protein C with HTH and peptisase S24 domain
MSARVFSIREFTPRPGHYSLLVSELPGHSMQTLGVLLLDPESNELHIRLRRDWNALASEEDAEVLSELQDDLARQAREEGGGSVLDRLTDWASGAIRVTDREAVTVRNFERTLNDLYRRHVPAEVLRFRTHLPKYSLTVAAGPFLGNPDDIEAEDWIETPPDLRLDGNMFVARIQGHSMEPRIPDGSLCVFRRNVVGSRNGKLVLVRDSELADENRFTVKRYLSEKDVTENGYAQRRIRLISLNPSYPSWDLDEDSDKYQIVAEFVRVLDNLSE